jgi:hypothetical protein
MEVDMFARWKQSWSTGWTMARETFAIMQQYPKLAVFPVISGAVLLLIVGPIVLSLLPQIPSLYAVTGPLWDRLGESDSGMIAAFVAGALGLYVLWAVAIFCNVALVRSALDYYAGREPSVRAGFAAAMTCLPQILGWAFVALTVGVILSAIQGLLKDKLGLLGDLVGGLFEIGWSVVTYFVLPVLAAEKLGPIAAVRRSSAIVRSKWGESLAGETQFGIIGLLLFVLAAALFGAGLAIHLSYSAAALGLGVVLMAIGLLGAAAAMAIMSALSTVFQTGVYLYATTGQVPAALDADLVKGAFKPKS